MIDKCPSGYDQRIGDAPGWGSDLGSELELSRQDCANQCNSKPDCLSFEHSNSEGLCNLNRVGEPSNQVQFHDYVYCLKKGNV